MVPVVFKRVDMLRFTVVKSMAEVRGFEEAANDPVLPSG